MAHEKERAFIGRLREVCKKHHTMAILSDEAIADFLSTLPEEKEEVLKDWTTCSNYKTTCCGLGVGGKCPCFSYSVRFNPNNQ